MNLKCELPREIYKKSPLKRKRRHLIIGLEIKIKIGFQSWVLRWRLNLVDLKPVGSIVGFYRCCSSVVHEVFVRSCLYGNTDLKEFFILRKLFIRVHNIIYLNNHSFNHGLRIKVLNHYLPISRGTSDVPFKTTERLTINIGRDQLIVLWYREAYYDLVVR
jgi:hypothetical protein